jgi:hypothetical protein
MFFFLVTLWLFAGFARPTGAVADDSFLTPGAKLTAAAEAENDDQFGFSVTVSGTNMVVGVPYKGNDACPAGKSCNSGAVYLFKSDGNTWVPSDTLSKLTAGVPADVDKFGWSVAIDGDQIAVGAPFRNEGNLESGAVYLFRYDGSTWVPDGSQEKLTASSPKGYEWFGFSVALDGNKLVVGAPGTGSVYVFERQQDSTWRSMISAST